MGGTNLNRSHPVIDFTSLDADGLIADMIAYAKASHSDRWTDFNQTQLARVLLDELGYQGDIDSFYLNALINEVFVTSAVRRQNLIELAKQFDYEVPGAAAASGAVTVVLDPAGTYPATISATSTAFSNGSSRDEVIFMPVSSVVVAAYSPTPLSVSVVEGRLVTGELLGNSNGGANQRFRLANASALLDTLMVYVGGVAWTRARHAVDMAASDTKFLVEINDRDETFVVFGDNVNGRVPSLAAAITADYKHGGGRRGNLNPASVTTIVSAPDIVQSVTNPSATSGGADRPSNAQIRKAIPAALRSYSGAITDLDMADVAINTPGGGVAKARAAPGDPLTRAINLYIAPSGGGYPSAVLKNSVHAALSLKKMIGQRITIQDPVYKDAVVELLIYVRSGTKRDDADSAVRNLLTNTDGSGLFDFNQQDFGGVDEEGNPLVSRHSLQQKFDTVARLVDRVVIEQLYVRAGYRRFGPTTGDGTISSIVQSTNDNERREYVVRMTSATTYTVSERIVGTVKQVLDNGIVDDEKNFGDLVLQGFTLLNPDRRMSTFAPVVTNTPTQVTCSGTSLFLLTETGAEYFVERPIPGVGTVGVTYTVTDVIGQTLLSFTVDAGASPFASGDELVIDVYPTLTDIVLRPDEILQLNPVDLTTRLSGGVAT